MGDVAEGTEVEESAVAKAAAEKDQEIARLKAMLKANEEREKNKTQELQKQVLESRKLIEKSKQEQQLPHKVNQAVYYYGKRLTYSKTENREEALLKTKRYCDNLARPRDIKTEPEDKHYYRRLKELDNFIYRSQKWCMKHEAMLAREGRSDEILQDDDPLFKGFLASVTDKLVKESTFDAMTKADRTHASNVIEDVHNNSLLNLGIGKNDPPKKPTP